MGANNKTKNDPTTAISIDTTSRKGKNLSNGIYYNYRKKCHYASTYI